MVINSRPALKNYGKVVHQDTKISWPYLGKTTPKTSFLLVYSDLKADKKSFYDGQHFGLEDSHLYNLRRNELKIQESSLDFLNWFVGTCFPYYESWLEASSKNKITIIA